MVEVGGRKLGVYRFMGSATRSRPSLVWRLARFRKLDAAPTIGGARGKGVGAVKILLRIVCRHRTWEHFIGLRKIGNFPGKAKKKQSGSDASRSIWVSDLSLRLITNSLPLVIFNYR